MERSMGWRPGAARRPGGAPYPYLITLGQAGPARRRVHLPLGRTATMLGWVCERASGTRMAGPHRGADLASRWEPNGRRDHLRSTGVSAHPRRRRSRRPAREPWPGFGQLLVDDRHGPGVNPVHPGGLAGRHPAPPIAAVRGGPFAATEKRAGPARLAGTATSSGVIPGPGGAGAGLPRHPRPARVRRPRYAYRGRQDVILAGTLSTPATCLDTLRACAALTASLSAGGL